MERNGSDILKLKPFVSQRISLDGIYLGLIYDIKRAMFYVRWNSVSTSVKEKHVETACLVPGSNNVTHGRYMASIRCDIISSR